MGNWAPSKGVVRCRAPGCHASDPLLYSTYRPRRRERLHLALLPSRRPFFRAVRKVTDRPTVFSGPGVRRVRDRPTDPLPGGCAVTTLALLVGSYLYFPPQTRKTVPGVGSFTRGAQRPFRNFCPSGALGWSFRPTGWRARRDRNGSRWEAVTCQNHSGARQSERADTHACNGHH